MNYVVDDAIGNQASRSFAAQSQVLAGRDPLINAAVGRIGEIVERLSKIDSQLYTNADRVFGEQPTGLASASANPPVSGSIAALNEAIDRLGSTASRLAATAARFDDI